MTPAPPPPDTPDLTTAPWWIRLLASIITAILKAIIDALPLSLPQVAKHLDAKINGGPKP